MIIVEVASSQKHYRRVVDQALELFLLSRTHEGEVF